MAIRATIAPGYRWRLAIIAVMCLFWGAWSIYDGFVAYPAHNEKVAAFESLKTSFPAPDDWQPRWKAMAAEKGWSDEDPGKPKSSTDIIAQYIMALITAPIGLIFGFNFLSTYTRWVECDENGLTASGGQKAPYVSITNLNTERWGTKGIAVVSYNAEDNLPRKLVLDDWKYDRDATTQIVHEVESRIAPEQLTGPPTRQTAVAEQPTETTQGDAAENV